MKIPFQVSARAGKLLGRENFSNPEGAIIELVKNSYDADAENCFVIFDIPTREEIDEHGDVFSIPDRTMGSIYIIDNGEWMTKETVENYWMQIGTGNKEQVYLSKKERVKTWAKGIGRFALDRLGKKTEMWTSSVNSNTNTGISWGIDWMQFDDLEKNISEITADLFDIPSLNLKDKIVELLGSELMELKMGEIGFKHGTIIKITDLKDDWYTENLDSIFSHLEALVPPEELQIPFHVNYTHLQDQKKYGTVHTAFFNDFDYKVTARFNGETLKVDFTVERTEFDIDVFEKKYGHLYEHLSFPFDINTIKAWKFEYSKDIEKLLHWDANEGRQSLLRNIGSFWFSFHYVKFILSKKENYPYKNTANVKERKATLERFGGIKIYRDSFRVRPYGDPKNDWLGLGFRAAKSPAGPGQRIWDWRVNSESLAGIITISRKENPLLEDKSDRGGFQENETFEVFRNIITGIIHEFEVDRSRMMNPIYLFNKQEEERKKNEEIEKRAKEMAKKMVAETKKMNEEENEDEKKEEAYEEFFKDSLHGIIDDSREEENQEIAQVRSLASLGLIVSSFSHELKEVSNNASEIETLEKNVLSIIPKERMGTVEYLDITDIFQLLKGDKEKIKHWVDYTLTAIKKDKRTRTKLNFTTFFSQFNKSWERIFKRKDVHLIIYDRIKDTPYTFRAFEMDMTTVFSNLINNSIDSFEQRKSIDERNVIIDFSIVNNKIEIIFSDNGKGLDNEFDNKEDIFLPFITSKRDRKGNEIWTGLGMYLVKSVIDDNGGTIEILEPPVGFAVKITFPLINL